VVSSVTNEAIACTSARQLPSAIPAVKSFEFMVDGQIGVVLQAPIYVYRWSNSQTWGGDVPPIDGDLVQVPNGLVLLIDQDVPKIAGLYSNYGGIIVEDTRDVTMRPGFIFVVGGFFQIGTETTPFTHNCLLEFNGKPTDPQIPVYGSKGLACHNCELNIHGKVRTKSWTKLAADSPAGSTTITLA
jgi:hypothetical protein